MSSLFLTSHLSWLKIWLLPISVENMGNTRARSMCSRPGRSAECWAEPCSVRGTAVIPQQQGLQAGRLPWDPYCQRQQVGRLAKLFKMNWNFVWVNVARFGLG